MIVLPWLLLTVLIPRCTSSNDATGEKMSILQLVSLPESEQEQGNNPVSPGVQIWRDGQNVADALRHVGADSAPGKLGNAETASGMFGHNSELCITIGHSIN